MIQREQDGTSSGESGAGAALNVGCGIFLLMASIVCLTMSLDCAGDTSENPFNGLAGFGYLLTALLAALGVALLARARR